MHEGLIVYTKLFPGWNRFGAFLHHMEFVKKHHKAILRVAIVTDSKIGSIVPVIANSFISTQVKHFRYDGFDDAKQWIESIHG